LSEISADKCKVFVVHDFLALAVWARAPWWPVV